MPVSNIVRESVDNTSFNVCAANAPSITDKAPNKAAVIKNPLCIMIKIERQLFFQQAFVCSYPLLL